MTRSDSQRRKIASHYVDLVTAELQFCARAIEHMDSGATAAKWLRRRIIKIIQEKSNGR